MSADPSVEKTTSSYVLAVDLGTGGPKVAIVSTHGEVIAHTYATNELFLSEGGGAEQDPEEWWATITDGMRELVAAGHVPADRIRAISVSTQWMGTVAVGNDDRHLMNAVIWMDARGAQYADNVAGGGLEVPGTGYNALRLKKWLQVTGGVPSRTGKDPVGHILWIKNERPDVYRDTKVFLEPMDYLNLRLTGIAAAAFDTITGYWCTDNRDLSNVTYDDGLIKQCGLERSKLPDLVPTGTILGPITGDVAADLGLTTDVQVVMGTGDTASAGIGSGAVRDFEAHLYVGTSSWLSCHVPFKRTDILNNITSLPSGIPNRYWVATEQDVAGKAMSWLIDNVLYPEDALESGKPPEDTLDRLNEMAAGVPEGSHNVIFLPWLNGERTPVDDHHLRGGWYNASLTTNRATMVRALFEGVALNSKWMLVTAEKFVKSHRPHGFEHINFVGGGARSDLWCQIMADVMDRPIRQVADSVLANVRGAGFSAAVALGEIRWTDIPDKIEIAHTYTPNPAHRATYDTLYEVFVGIYKCNKKLFARLNPGHEQ